MEWKGLTIAIIVAVAVALAGPFVPVNVGPIELPMLAIILAIIVGVITEAFFGTENKEQEPEPLEITSEDEGEDELEDLNI